MNADGSGQHNLTRSPGNIDWGPAWSPDGRRIVWNSDPGAKGTFRSYLMDSGGDHVSRVPADVYVEYPAWSPDGSKIAFMGQEAHASGDDPAASVGNPDGTIEGVSSATAPRWDDRGRLRCPDLTSARRPAPPRWPGPTESP